MITGEFVRDGRRGMYRPDPYGRWIMGANLLPLLEGDAYGTRSEREKAAAALSRLARTAGRNGTLAREAVYRHPDRDVARVGVGWGAGRVGSPRGAVHEPGS